MQRPQRFGERPMLGRPSHSSCSGRNARVTQCKSHGASATVCPKEFLVFGQVLGDLSERLTRKLPYPGFTSKLDFIMAHTKQKAGSTCVLQGNLEPFDGLLQSLLLAFNGLRLFRCRSTGEPVNSACEAHQGSWIEQRPAKPTRIIYELVLELRSSGLEMCFRLEPEIGGECAIFCTTRNEVLL